MCMEGRGPMQSTKALIAEKLNSNLIRYGSCELFLTGHDRNHVVSKISYDFLMTGVSQNHQN